MAMNYDKGGAVIELVRDFLEGSRRARSRASYARVKKAIAVLGLNEEETKRVLIWMEYHNDANQPRAWCAPKSKS